MGGYSMVLNGHSYYSLLYGTLSPEDVVKHCKEKDLKCIALTDINNTSAWFDFYRACINSGIKPLLGIEFRDESYKPLYIGIAKNNQGLYELNKFQSHHSIEALPLPSRPPRFENVIVIYRYGFCDPDELRDNEFIGINYFELPALFSSPLKHYKDKLVAMNSLTFVDKVGYQTHCLLRCIDQNTTIHKLDKSYIASSNEIFYSLEELENKFEAFPELLKNTQRIIDNCSVELNISSNKNLKFFTGSKEDDFKLLEKLTYDGYMYRFEANNKKALARIKKELKVINELGFVAYFLITNDIIQYARSRGYYHVGRGSGANSIVAYCLRITDVDPLELDLYFERFINPERTSPPDFDIDFSWDERDDVIEYIFRRYGREHVSLLATYTTFQDSSAIRELGKVFGLPKNEIDKIVEEPEAINTHHAFAPKIHKYKKYIEGLPKNLSIHAGGILITQDSIYNFTSLQMMPKGFPINQFDMHVAEENGFYKFDILSQRGLGHIKEAVKLVRKNRQISIDIHRVEDFKHDENICERLRSAKTIGAFYIESPAMRGLLSKLKCDNYISLVAASSIIRPGVAESGMMREYIKRSHDPKNIQYLHPVFEEHLGETYGVMVYQEDVIKIAHHFAGLELGEADVLRRMMSGKSRGKKEAERIESKYFKNCKEKGYSDELSLEVWRQIKSFAGYSFCKAHSASYAVESYQSLFLKTYYPLEFMVGVLNNFGGFYSIELYVHEARMCGAIIEAPCVNKSEYAATIYDKTIYLGFVHLKGLEAELAKEIITERKRNGLYKSLEDFVNRTRITREQLTILIRIGALRFTGSSKVELMWNKNNFLRAKKEWNSSERLFSEESQTEVLPVLDNLPQEEIYEQIDLLGFPLMSPFELLKSHDRGDVKSSDLIKHAGKCIRIAGYYVTRKVVPTKNGSLMNFGTWLDIDGNWFDSTHFNKSLEKYPFRGKAVYMIEGKVVLDFGFPSIEVTRMEKMEWVLLRG
jgi:DNA polymerase-3 subunit alpha